MYSKFAIEKRLMDFFNHKIIERHDDQTTLNNQMAEFYDMLIDLPWNEKSDSTWYYDQKKSYICYDV
jgi:hypothetical protein